MRVQSLCLFVIVLSTCVGGAGQDKPRDEREALQGSWVLIEQLPRAIPDIRCERIVFKGDKLTLHYRLDGQIGVVETRFKLNPKAKPKAIEFTPTEGDRKGEIFLGIYELKGDELKISYRGSGASRPRDFDDKMEGNQSTIYFMLKRSPAK